MRCKALKDIDTALRIYYTYPEIGNKEIKELFGKIGPNTITKYKKAVKKVQTEEEVFTSSPYTINTETAYKVWGIDVGDLERRRKKLKDLGLSA